MEKYRLKKWYPSLHNNWKEGDIATKSKSGAPLYKGKPINENLDAFVSESEVKENPEFWEKIEEKKDTAEVLSYTPRTTDDLVVCSIPVTDLPSFEYSEIRMVRRISDGEVFRLGEAFITHTGKTDRISKIRIIREFNEVSLEWATGLGNTELQNAKKYSPLFTTEDGKSILEGNSFYPVCIKDGFGFTPFTFIPQKWTKRCLNKESFKYFSTKEAAQNFIIENKPCLSVKDVLKALNTKDFCTEVNLKDAVKNKFNL